MHLFVLAHVSHMSAPGAYSFRLQLACAICGPALAAQDLDDPDRASFTEKDLAFYYSKYFKKTFSVRITAHRCMVWAIGIGIRRPDCVSGSLLPSFFQSDPCTLQEDPLHAGRACGQAAQGVEGPSTRPWLVMPRKWRTPANGLRGPRDDATACLAPTPLLSPTCLAWISLVLVDSSA